MTDSSDTWSQDLGPHGRPGPAADPGGQSSAMPPARPPHGLRTWGAGSATQLLARARLAQLRRHAVVGSAVRLEPSVLIRGNVGGLVLGSRVHLARGVVLRVEASHGRLRLGDDTTVHQYSLLRTQQGWIDIGHHVSVHPFGIINGEGGVRIGDDVRIGPRVTILSSTHTYGDPDVLVRCQPTQPLPVVIDDDVWVGTGVTVLGGTTIGRGAVIGAGAVVNQDVAPFVVVAGVPARPVGTRGPDDVHPAVSS